jgi:Ran GTPase-activating protein (RanGAP) involved in mRNA processing and transport
MMVLCNSGNTGLQKLDLHSKGVGAPGVQALQQAIAAGSGLDHLTLSGNSLGDEGAAAVAPAIPFIREVKISSSLPLLGTSCPTIM